MIEFYQDRAVGEAHVQARLKEMGFIVEGGRMFSLEDMEGNTVKVPKERKQ